MTEPSIKLGMAWGSGGARGWAHVGVLRAFEELEITIDIEAGCSAGALVSAARRLGIWDEFLAWGREIGPIGALSQFAIRLGAGGFINPARAIETFRYADRKIEELTKPWGAVATDLATGKELWLTQGSVLDAARASASIPMVLQAAPVIVDGVERWLIDGATSNPVPVSLAQALGANRVIAVDLNSSAATLTRFDRPDTREITVVEPKSQPPNDGPLPDAVVNLLRETRDFVGREIAMAKAKSQAKPHLFETAAATLDIVQIHLAQALAQIDIADVRITPNLADLSPAAFHQHAEIEERGYLAAMAVRDQLEALRDERHQATSASGDQQGGAP
ncbi:MAG: patatin-like phospholipase family protein [Pseudomonadota bacterium]